MSGTVSVAGLSFFHDGLACSPSRKVHCVLSHVSCMLELLFLVLVLVSGACFATAVVEPYNTLCACSSHEHTDHTVMMDNEALYNAGHRISVIEPLARAGHLFGGGISLLRWSAECGRH